MGYDYLLNKLSHPNDNCKKSLVILLSYCRIPKSNCNDGLNIIC